MIKVRERLMFVELLTLVAMLCDLLIKHLEEKGDVALVWEGVGEKH